MFCEVFESAANKSNGSSCSSLSLCNNIYNILFALDSLKTVTAKTHGIKAPLGK